MSVRAHLVRKFEYDGEVFNLWHDKYFVEILDCIGILDGLNIDGYGIIEINRSQLQMIKESIDEDEKEGSVKKEDTQRAREILTQIRKAMRGKDYVLFYCF